MTHATHLLWLAAAWVGDSKLHSVAPDPWPPSLPHPSSPQYWASPQSVSVSMTLHYKPDNAKALFLTAADAPPAFWDGVAACVAPTRAQRTALQQLWHAFAGHLQGIQ